jgi:tubulin-specific chaperone B
MSPPLYSTVHNAYKYKLDTVLEYKQAHQVGRFAPKVAAPEHSAADESAAVVSARNITVGVRCEVASTEDGSGVNNRGTVRYVGPTEFGNKTGVWVGIEYDLPYGKNDGS